MPKPSSERFFVIYLFCYKEGSKKTEKTFEEAPTQYKKRKRLIGAAFPNIGIDHTKRLDEKDEKYIFKSTK